LLLSVVQARRQQANMVFDFWLGLLSYDAAGYMHIWTHIKFGVLLAKNRLAVIRDMFHISPLYVSGVS